MEKHPDEFSFEESPINFPPTYKFDVNTSNYDTSSKKRIPSYTDRIIFKENISTDSKCICIEYSSISDIMISDHKPVYGLFTLKVK